MTDYESESNTVECCIHRRVEGMIPKEGKPKEMGIRIVDPDDLLRKLALLRTKVSPAP